MPADELQHQVDRFVALSLLIDEELLGPDLDGLQELFSQRQKCLDRLQELTASGHDLTLKQKQILAQQDDYTQAVIQRLQTDLRLEAGQQSRRRQSRRAYSDEAKPHYELTG
ncbi:MAG: hypothetical protein JNM28_09380 [Armatimonadetes bacterium]|nr:hypothetical protein [Armatimonadota bacterium]MBS1710727.1 hypothetical protein [Armatimonadota bacterium]MBX3108398.1 hypothetical protein [Fimbriimonadaceae bacterium]